MHFQLRDFNASDQYFAGTGAAEWLELEAVLKSLPAFFQASDQKGKAGSPIFDPKATNAHLCAESQRRGWRVIPVPEVLRPFGDEWDAGKASTLAEWQFSNYPFLWNNVIRTEAVFRGKVQLSGLQPIAALVVVTKSGIFPASNSTLYYEQAIAQLSTVMSFNTFSVPIRVVGLTIPPDVDTLSIQWSAYSNPRYDRAPTAQSTRTLRILRTHAVRVHGTPGARFTLVD
jgi:hypothetical protein